MAAEALDRLIEWAIPEAPPDHPARALLAEALGRVENPAAFAAGVRRLRDLGDPLVASGERFLDPPPNPFHETWPFPVTLASVAEIDRGRLLALPPGSRRFGRYRAAAAAVVDAQMAAVFPRLVAEVANRPNLFFPGVFFPHELSVRNVEMISARHGTYYVSEVEIDRAGEAAPARVVAKPADMDVEALVTHMLRDLNRRMRPAVRDRIGPIAVPTTVSVGGRYGLMERVPGGNGVEFLPRGVATAGIAEFALREYPEGLDLSRADVLKVAREFAKQAVMAFYLRLYDRKPDQMMFHRDSEGALRVTHIDFGRGLKRNYALPWKRHYDPARPPLLFRDHEIPYFEAAAALIYLPHFVPARFRGDLDPWAGEMREAILETFVGWAEELRRNAGVVLEWYGHLPGTRTQYRPHEVDDVRVRPEDVADVRDALLALDDPAEAAEAVLHLAFHERAGTTPVEGPSDEDDGVYRRALEPGPRPTRLVPEVGGDRPYRLRDYRSRGRIRHDPDERVLTIEFGDDPDRVVEEIAGTVSRLLAAWIRLSPAPLRGLKTEVRADGEVTVRLGGGLVRRGLRLPEEVRREVFGALSGAAPSPHVVDIAAAYHEWKRAHPDADTRTREVEKARLVAAHDLAATEVLQFYLAQEDPDSPLRPAIEEAIGFLLSNPDFLVDKDPYDTINQYVVSLGRKHGFVRPLPDDLFPEALRAEPAFLRAVLSVMEASDGPAALRRELAPHRVHLGILVRLAGEIAARAGLGADETRLLLSASLLHDLAVLDPTFRGALTEPCGRTWPRFVGGILDRHAEIAAERLDALGDRLPLPDGVERGRVRALVAGHHGAGGGAAAEILHVADTLAVFADGTRPETWIQGGYRTAEIAPRWLDAQRARGQVSGRVHAAAAAFFADPAAAPTLRALDELSAPYLKAFNALHLAAMLRSGLHPHHPGLLDELRERHGRARVDRIWETVLASNATVREKVSIVHRIYDLAPLFEAEGLEAYAFVDASARPVQRTVEVVEGHVAAGRTVILVGFFPRVAKTFERLGAAAASDRVVVVAGEHRLQFIRYSYPHEGEREVPIHRAIEAWRAERRVAGRLCLVPLRRVFEAGAAGAAPPAAAAAAPRASLAKPIDDLGAPDEAIEAEAARYRAWFEGAPVGSFDAPERERFRRILLNGYANRDVLSFFLRTLPPQSGLAAPLGEVIGALRENPNHLADRSHYYAIHEMVRSLALVHFPTTSPASVEARLRGLAGPAAAAASLVVAPRPDLSFALHPFVSALEIAEALAAAWPAGAPPPAERRRLARWIGAATALLEDPVVAEHLLSPEDVSTNATLRRCLIESGADLSARIAERAPDAAGLSRPAGEAEAALAAIAGTALHLALYADESRIENWRRAKIDIGRDDLREVGGTWLAVVGPTLPPAVRGALAEALDRAAAPGPVLDLLNRLAGLGDDYVLLYDALTIAAELRWGLTPRGIDVVQNVRMMFGTRLADLLVDAIVGAQMPPRDKVKFARKLPMWADALRPEAEGIDEVRILNADSLAALSRVEEVRAALGGRVLFVVAGSHEKATALFERVAAGLGPADRLALARALRVLVGEEYPVLMKEKTTLLTEWIQARIRAHRAATGSVRRRLLVPAEVVLDLDDAARALLPPPVLQREPPDAAGRFFRAWIRRFE